MLSWVLKPMPPSKVEGMTTYPVQTALKQPASRSGCGLAKIQLKFIIWSQRTATRLALRHAAVVVPAGEARPALLVDQHPRVEGRRPVAEEGAARLCSTRVPGETAARMPSRMETPVFPSGV